MASPHLVDEIARKCHLNHWGEVEQLEVLYSFNVGLEELIFKALSPNTAALDRRESPSCG
jgi:hypothetical protein